MKFYLLTLIFLAPLLGSAQVDLLTPFTDCRISGSSTVYDYKAQKWIYSDTADSRNETLPASTFKVVNLLIALETGVIRDENEVVKWVGEVDTVLYGYRPEIYKDMTVKDAFEQSAGWVFIELAKRIGKENYRYYLEKCKYGNQKLSERGDDFWNFGAFGITPVNQINFLKAVYEEKAPFSTRNLAILKRVMISEQTNDYVIRSKTGWTRYDGKDTGWWVGYVERKDNVYFFATRIQKSRTVLNPNFGSCRKEITKKILRQLGAL